MQDDKILNYIGNILKNVPKDWLNLTTHRLDIYNEKLAKTQFLEQLENLYKANNSATSAFEILPTAYDYIRLGHPLSCILEWTLAKLNQLQPEQVISFSSQTITILAILRSNLLKGKNTQILYTEALPKSFDADIIKRVYGYNFELKQVENEQSVSEFNGSTVFISKQNKISINNRNPLIDFYVNLHAHLGSVLTISGKENTNYISDIQHVRRRETIAMTPSNCVIALKALIE